MVGRGRQDGGRGFRRRGARPQDRDHLRRSPEQAGPRQRHRAALVRCRKRRHDHRTDDLLGRARGSRAFEGKEEDRHRRRRGDVAPHRRCLPALRFPLGLRYARAGVRHRRLAGGSRRRQLVLHDRRLRLRLCAGEGHQRFRQGQGRQGARLGPHSAELRRTSPRSCCRRRARKPRSSASPMPASTPPTRSSRRRNSASSRAARSSPACC